VLHQVRLAVEVHVELLPHKLATFVVALHIGLAVVVVIKLFTKLAAVGKIERQHVLAAIAVQIDLAT